MKVSKLIIELREMNLESEVILLVDNGEFVRIITSEERVMIKRKGGPTWEKAVEAWPDAVCAGRAFAPSSSRAVGTTRLPLDWNEQRRRLGFALAR